MVFIFLFALVHSFHGISCFSAEETQDWGIASRGLSSEIDQFCFNQSQVLLEYSYIPESITFDVAKKMLLNKPKGKRIVRVAVNAWLSSRLGAEIASIMIEEFLGYNVVFVMIADESKQWELLRDNKVDVVLEVWPSGHIEQYSMYVQHKQVILDIGPLGVIGRIGWFVPDYVTEKNQFLEYWRQYQIPNTIAKFHQPNLHICGDSGKDLCTGGLFLGGDAAWLHFEEALMNNLHLNFSISWTNKEEADERNIDTEMLFLEQVQDMYNQKKNFLFYLWDPHHLLSKLQLNRILLPHYSTTCPTTKNDISCDYPPELLYKIMNPKLDKEAIAVSNLLRLLTLSNDDHIQLLASVSFENQSPREAACNWLKTNSAKWKNWILREECPKQTIKNVRIECSNRGLCHFGECVCLDGYSGSACERDVITQTQAGFISLTVIGVTIALLLSVVCILLWFWIKKHKVRKKNLKKADGLASKKIRARKFVSKNQRWQPIIKIRYILSESSDILFKWLVFLHLFSLSSHFWPWYTCILLLGSLVTIYLLVLRIRSAHQHGETVNSGNYPTNVSINQNKQFRPTSLPKRHVSLIKTAKVSNKVSPSDCTHPVHKTKTVNTTYDLPTPSQNEMQLPELTQEDHASQNKKPFGVAKMNSKSASEGYKQSHLNVTQMIQSSAKSDVNQSKIQNQLQRVRQAKYTIKISFLKLFIFDLPMLALEMYFFFSRHLYYGMQMLKSSTTWESTIISVSFFDIFGQSRETLLLVSLAFTIFSLGSKFRATEMLMWLRNEERVLGLRMTMDREYNRALNFRSRK